MMPHQEQGLLWAVPKSRIALFWQMRLGKTLLAIRWVLDRWVNNLTALTRPDVLIVSPSSVCSTWIYELGQEGFHSVTELRGAKAIPGPGWNVTSYETLRINTHIQYHKWKVVILDESVAIRNPKAKTTKVCLHAFKDVPDRAILTGNPNPESWLDVFTQIQFLLSGFMGRKNFWDWRGQFCDLEEDGYRWCVKRAHEQEMIESLTKVGQFLTRKEVGLASDKVRETRLIEMPAKLQEIYDQAEKFFELGDVQTIHRIVVGTWLSQLAGGSHPFSISDHKQDELVSLLTGELAREQVIVWYHFNTELRRTSDLLTKKGVDHAPIIGQQPSKLRDGCLTLFRKGWCRVLLVQSQCLKYGVDLSCCSTAIYYSNNPEADVRSQSEDRIVHPKKTESNLIIDLVTKGTVDEDVLAALNNKKLGSASLRQLASLHFKQRLKAKYGTK